MGGHPEREVSKTFPRTLPGHLVNTFFSRRCMDFVFYFPKQKVPDAGMCGLGACGGNIGSASELAAEHDFDRTFGIVDTCATNNVAEDAEVRSPG